jgi:hypothetical protein
MQFGELVNVLNAFSSIKEHLNDKEAANLALSVVQKERAILIHPTAESKGDIDEAQFRKVRMAIETLKHSFSQIW